MQQVNKDGSTGPLKQFNQDELNKLMDDPNVDHVKVMKLRNRIDSNVQPNPPKIVFNFKGENHMKRNVYVCKCGNEINVVERNIGKVKPIIACDRVNCNGNAFSQNYAVEQIGQFPIDYVFIKPKGDKERQAIVKEVRKGVTKVFPHLKPNKINQQCTKIMSQILTQINQGFLVHLPAERFDDNLEIL